MAKKFDSKALSGQSKIADAAFSKAPRVSFDGEAADVSVERYWRAMHDWARASKVDEGCAPLPPPPVLSSSWHSIYPRCGNHAQRPAD